MCLSAGLAVEEGHGRAQLSKAFLTGEVCIKEQFLETLKKKKVPPVEKKPIQTASLTKPEIAPGISANDLQTHYYLDELVEWCEKDQVKTGGNKREMIKRILAFLV